MYFDYSDIITQVLYYKGRYFSTVDIVIGVQ
jgi:hypothetical protein